MVRWDYFADVRPSGQTPLSLVGVTRYPRPHGGLRGRPEHRLGHRRLRDARTHRRGMDGLAAAPRDHPDRLLPRRGRRRSMPALPGVLRGGRSGATYAMEFGVRRF